MQVPLIRTASQGMTVPFNGMIMTSPGTRSVENISSISEFEKKKEEIILYFGIKTQQTNKRLIQKSPATSKLLIQWVNTKTVLHGESQQTGLTLTHHQGWRDSLWVKITGCFSRRPEFNSQHQH